MKKIIGLGLLVLSLSTAMLFANGSQDKGTADASSSGKVKLTGLFVSHPLTKSIKDMKWLKEIEDAAGVDITWEQIYTDWDQTKATRFASGNIPDILINATTDSDYVMYNGLFADLTDLIDKDAPNVKAMFKEEPDTKVMAETLDNKIYALPKFQGKWPATNTVLFINQKWLDKLGLKMPTTFSEFKKVLEAFKANDCNGNGNANDEIPLDFSGWFGSAYGLPVLMGGLGVQLTNWAPDAYFAENGKVKNYAVDPRYKLFVKYCAGLWKEGLINENSITNDYSEYQSLSRGDENGKALVGCVFGWEETDKFGKTLSSEYKPVPPLKYDINVSADTYDTKWVNDYTGLNISSNRICMSAKCKNKDAAMRFMNNFYDSTVSVECLFGGISDGCVSKVGDNHFKVEPPLDADTDPGTWKWTNAFADFGPMYIRQSTKIDMNWDMVNAINERKVYASVLGKLKTDSSDGNYYPQQFMKYSADDLNSMAVLQANITNITDNYWALWLTGQSDINKDWDAYVKSINDAGLPQVLKIRQKAYDTYRNKK